MKIGIIVDLLKLPLTRGIATAAALGADGIQLYAIGKDCNFLKMSRGQIWELRQRCRDAGMTVSAVCGDLGGHGFQIAAENPNKLMALKRIIDGTVELGCRIVTTHIGVIPADHHSETYQVMQKAIFELAEYACQCGTVIAIETGPEPATVLNRFIGEVGSKGVGVNLDPANLVMVLDEDPIAAVHTLRRHIVHTHAKDGIHYRQGNPQKIYHAFAEGGFEQLEAETGTLFAEMPLGQGQIDWPGYLLALKAIGYDGFLTIEREVGENPITDITRAMDFLKQQLATI